MGQLEEWQKLSERFSVIPLVGKKPIEVNWQRWCREKRQFDPKDFKKKNAGVACGPASKVIVLDVDHIEYFKEYALENQLDIPKTFTVRSGSGKSVHLYYAYPNGVNSYGCTSIKDPKGRKNDKDKLITIADIRGIGGQVVAPFSIHPDTQLPYSIERDIPFSPCPHWISEMVTDEVVETETIPHWVWNDVWDGNISSLPVSREVKELIISGADIGSRSEAIMSVVNALVFANLSDAQIVSIFDHYSIGEKYREKKNSRGIWIMKHIKKARDFVTERAEPKRTKPPVLTERSMRDAVATVATVADVTNCYKVLQNTPKVLQTVTNSPNYLETFKLWLETCDGEFKMSDAARELGWYENPNHYACFRRIIPRAVDLGLIAKVGSVRGIYRTIYKVYKEMDLELTVVEEFPIILPLNLHHLVEINPKEIILIAGETNAGKSCLIFNILWDNIRNLEKLNLLRPKTLDDAQKIGLRYFSSEMGPAVVKKKLLDFGPAYPIQDFIKNVVSIERNYGFQDLLDPNGINCIDYLEAPGGDYYKMAPTITEIFSKLDRGVAVIAIQKRTGTDIGRGGEGTLEKPRLAIALSYNREKGYFTAKITKAKVPREGIGIDGKEIDFLIHKGVSILPVSDWDYPSKHEKRRKSVNYREEKHYDPDSYHGEW